MSARLLVAVVALMATAICVTTATFSATPANRFQPYCNYRCDGYNCPDPTIYGIAACDRTYTGGCNSRTPRGCWSQGIFPLLNEKGQPIRNGGIPQLANVTAHIEQMAAEIDKFMPDVNFSGNAVLDFEAWTPVFDQNDSPDAHWHGKVYQDASIALVKKNNPTWTNETLIRERAKEEFQAAGTNFFVATLEYLRSVRPMAQWGFYGFPQGHYRSHCGNNSQGQYRCGYASPTAGSVFQAQNDAINALWSASVALYPSVYLPPGTGSLWQESLSLYVNDTVTESVRLAKTYGGGQGQSDFIRVKSFYWALYHNATTYITPQDVTMVARNSYHPPHATEMVMWGSDYPGTTKNLPKFIANVEGPLLEQVQKDVNECAAKHCSGHGFCVEPFDVVVKAMEVPRCVCDGGWGNSTNCAV